MNTESSTSIRRSLASGIVFLLVSAATATFATETNKTAAASPDLTELNLEDLMHVKVTSVSRRPESLGAAAAAIYVVSQEDLQRQGFRTIADSLRTVPGMQVDQINSHTWAVSARGFNGEYADKLLVMMDGRSVYTPLFAGVYWDAQDMMLEDVDRIEVIRGPGATLWGANAVNGVVNVISKSAQDTQGLLVTGGGGTEERGFGGLRYGGQLGENAYYRVYTKYDNHDDMALPNGDSADDQWWMARGGFRIDWEAANANLLTLQGDLYSGREDWLFTLPTPTAPFTNTTAADDLVSGANVLGRWTHTFTDESELKFQTYYDHTERESNLPREDRDTFDAELQHHFVPLNRNDMVWGAGYRLTSDRIRNNFANTLDPAHRALQLFSAFFQDEITLVENRLRLTLGSKFEHNDFTGFEYQPGARLAWTPTDVQTVWAAVSRAVRTPSRAENDIRINRNAPAPPFPPGSVVSVLGNPDLLSEELIAYELGYRVLPHPRVSLDLATFFNVYDHLLSLEPGAPPSSPPVPVATYHVENKLKGQTYGAELAADWQLLDWWRIRASYTYFHMDLQLNGGTDTSTIQLLEGNSPRHQFSLHSAMDLPHHVEFDGSLRYVDSLADPHVPAYLTMDVRLSWHPTRRLELAVVGLNLLQERHAEFVPQVVATPQREVERSLYGKVTWRF